LDIPGGNLSKTVFAMKTCVFITGTNSVGKTSLAKALIGLFGGIEEATKELTICRDRRFALPVDIPMKAVTEALMRSTAQGFFRLS